MNYSDKLRDPRWQAKRLLIYQRDNFTCQQCFNKKKTIVVHHFEYIKNADPWDYPDSYLVTLCVECHKKGTEIFGKDLIKAKSLAYEIFRQSFSSPMLLSDCLNIIAHEQSATLIKSLCLLILYAMRSPSLFIKVAHLLFWEKIPKKRIGKKIIGWYKSSQIFSKINKLAPTIT